MTDTRHTFLIVDDEDGVRAALRRTLRGESYEILEAASAPAGLAILRARPVDVVISDHAMPEMTGLEFLRMARVVRPDALRIILTGQADLETAIRAINEDRVYRFLLKPWDQLDLRVMMRLAVRHLDSERRSARLLEFLRSQTNLVAKLEREHPEVLAVQRDDQGAIVLTDDELATLDAS
jgi:two-component system, probable response regulator PhcQ